MLVTPANRAALSDISATPVTSVSAASFEATTVAPESIVAAFGAQLATQTVLATDADPLTPGIQLPTQLAGTTVEVNGRRAGLFFVSPSQVNYVMPAETASGTANVVIRSGAGVTSNGTAQVAQVAPAVFTANSNGRGVPAAVLLRVKAGGQQSIEALSQFNAQVGRFLTKPIDLGPEGERVFLVLFMTGVRRADDPNGDNNLNDNIRLLVGGAETTPAFVGRQGEFVGLDQINAEIPRSLIGRGIVNVSVTATGFTTSNPVDIEIAGTQGASPPQVSGFASAALAGHALTINGAGFASVASENTVRIAGLNAEVMEATPASLTVKVPFGVESGTVSVKTASGEGMSASMLQVRTSISGVVEDTAHQPLADVTIKVSGLPITATTNAEGLFVLPDVPAGPQFVEVEGGSVNINPPYPKVTLKIAAQSDRDNHFARAIALQQATGSGGTIGSGTSPAGNDAGGNVDEGAAQAQPQPVTIQTDDFRLEIPDSTKATFPSGATRGTIFLTPLENARTPVELPFGYHSSSIVQITPFNVKLDPGGKLTFPNQDGFPAGAPAVLFRYDQEQGKFVQDAATAAVSADGQRIETAPGAIKTTTYYFAAVSRNTTTIVGRVLEKDRSTPVTRALVSFKGQEAATDGAGSYVLRYAPVRNGEALSVEVSVVRPSGRVDRASSDKISALLGGTTKVPDVAMPATTENRPPTILAPSRIDIEEGRISDAPFVVTDPDGNQIREVRVEGASFASVVRGGLTSASAYVLRFTPGYTQSGAYLLTVVATDSAGAVARRSLVLIVKNVNRAPAASNQSVTTDEDTAAVIRLVASDSDGDALTFAVVSPPANGALSGAAPNLTYRPNLNFNGVDRFTFRVSDGALNSNATVTITIRPVNDAPILTAPASLTVNEGQLLSFAVSAADVDAGQRLTITATDMPEGATLTAASPTSSQFRWTPTFTQAGAYNITFRVADDGAPSLSDTKVTRIAVFDTQRSFSQEPASFTVVGSTDAAPPQPGSHTGSSLAVGDVNGDGFADLAIGAPSGPASGAGGVHIFFGRSTLGGTVDLARQQADANIKGEAAGDLFGSSLAIGDINGDGRGDLIIGAPAADPTPDAPDGGKVYAVFGDLAPGTYDIAKVAGLTILGAARGDHLGASLAVGRVDSGQGAADLIVGAPLFDVSREGASLLDAGCAYGFWGSAALAGVKDLAVSPADFRITGAAANSHLGATLAAGNFNNGDLADIAIGAPEADDGDLKAAGVVHLVLGSIALRGAFSISQVAALTVTGGDAGDGAGSSLAMGDLNGDGRADVIAGAPGADGPNNERPGAGEVQIIFGMAIVYGRPPILTIFGGAAPGDGFPDGFGAEVALGDFTGDGIADLVIGAPGADPITETRQPTGAAYVIFGGTGLSTGVMDLTVRPADLSIFGAKSGDRLGSGGLAIGNLSGEEPGDLAIGAPAASKDSNTLGGAGEVRVLYGVNR
jgi:uncharacterized protein (TIGR03437 family)